MNAEQNRIALDAAVLRRSLLHHESMWRRVDIVTETGSTNADLQARSADGEDIRGVVLLAEYQRAGRGRRGRSWSAPARSQIAVSIGVDVEGVPTDAWGWLPLVAGLAVAQAVYDVTTIQPGLKWPNDVMVGNNKLAGILAEVATPATAVVLGIGLNVTMTAREAPDPRATSLLLLGSSVLDRTTIVIDMLGKLSARVSAWRSRRGADDELIADYCRHSLSIGTRVKASLPGGGEVVGMASGLDHAGRLIIDAADGRVTVSAGDISHLRPL